MKAKNLFIIEAIVVLLFGLAFVLLARWSMGLFGFTLGIDGLVMTQLVGTAFLGFAVLNWAARNVSALEDGRPVILANLAMNGLGFVVLLVHRLNGVGNAWSWIPIILYLLFGVAFGYLYVLMSRPQAPEARTKRA